MKLLFALAAMTAIVGGPASAASFDPAVEGVTAVHFVYGYDAGAGFVGYGAGNAFNGSGCQISTGAATTCLQATPKNFLGVYFTPVDGVSNTAFIFASDVTFHPGQNGEVSELAFVAPQAGSYRFTGMFRAVDAAAGNGVTFLTPQTSGIIAPGGSVGFAFNQTLAAGERAFFGIGNNGAYSYDTTGLQLSVGTVPEPAAWLMMIVGFGGVGAAQRRRTRTVAA